MRNIFGVFVPLMIILFMPVEGYSGQATITTYYSSPNADYKDITVANALEAGDVVMYGSNANGAPHVLDMLDNQIEAFAVGSSGGFLTVSGNVDINDTVNSLDLFHVDSVSGNVGIGVASPQALLDVHGEVKAIIVAAHMNVDDYHFPWFEMNAFYNEADIDNSSNANPQGDQAKFSAVRWQGPGQYVFMPLYLDGNPLVFQSIPKSGMTAAQGLGQVLIRSYVYTPPNAPDNNAILIIGEQDPTNAIYNTANEAGNPNPPWTPRARANNWNIFSSREYKKDIMPFSLSDYQHVFQQLSEAQVVSYHYKMDAPKARFHTGFIAEDAPASFASKGGRTISLANEAGFLLAALKALKLEDKDFKQRIERLRKWQKIGV